MDRKKFGAMLVALMAGVFLSASRVWAISDVGIGGYVMGDPAPGKLVPFFRVGPTLATIIGIESVEEDAFSDPAEGGEDISVRVSIFNKRSIHLLDFDLCLSPFDFGFVVLQQSAPNTAQLAELNHVTGPHTTRFSKVRFVSLPDILGTTEGYVTLRAWREWNTSDGTCGAGLDDPIEEDFDLFNAAKRPFGNAEFANAAGTREPLATWAILQDVGTGFFATEIPTPTAAMTSPGNDPVLTSGGTISGFGSLGLIPGPPPATPSGSFPFLAVAGQGSRVIARYDVNPIVGSKTEIFVWLKRNAFLIPGELESLQRGGALLESFLKCEDEFLLSTFILLPDEVNIIDPNTLSGIGQCKALGQFRGVLEFRMPDTGFLWSQITQEGEHFRENFLGYNLGDNDFIDCLDGRNDFPNDQESSPVDPAGVPVPLC